MNHKIFCPTHHFFLSARGVLQFYQFLPFRVCDFFWRAFVLLILILTSPGALSRLFYINIKFAPCDKAIKYPLLWQHADFACRAECKRACYAAGWERERSRCTDDKIWFSSRWLSFSIPQRTAIYPTLLNWFGGRHPHKETHACSRSVISCTLRSRRQKVK